MPYKPNPKTEGSGILCCIPQRDICPNKCPECFFQNGRSYLEPLANNLPNMPDPLVNEEGQVIRVNDGNDSNVDKAAVLAATQCYQHKFYNTAIPNLYFPGVVSYEYCGGEKVTHRRQMPVVLTINPGKMVDTNFFKLEDCWHGQRHHASDPEKTQRYLTPPPNLMFVRLLVSPFNTELVARAVKHWTDWQVPVVLTFMAYHQKPTMATTRLGQPCIEDAPGWVKRKRTLNTYWAVHAETWASIMFAYRRNPLVYSCGEGMNGSVKCARCGNCLREYFATKERMRDAHNTTVAPQGR